MTWQLVLIVHLASTWFLMGLIWTIQIVHYPAFADVDPDRYESFQQTHMARMGALVGPAWLVEGVMVLIVFALAPDTLARALTTVGGLLEATVILITLRDSIPAHRQLSRGFEREAHVRLIRTNWYRTAAWTGRGVIAAALLLAA